MKLPETTTMPMVDRVQRIAHDRLKPLVRKLQYDLVDKSNELEYGLRSRRIRTTSLSDRLNDRGITWEKAPSPRDISVLWIGANESQDDGGFLRGLHAVADDVQIARGPDNHYGVRQSSQDGKRHARVDPWLKEHNRAVLLGAFDQWQPRHPRRIVFGQLWAKHLDANVLQRMGTDGAVVVLLSMDDRHPMLWAPRTRHTKGMLGLSEGVDLVATTVHEAVSRYAVEGTPAFHIGFGAAVDPAIELIPWHERPIDVSFVGSGYGYRLDLISSLRAAGIEVEAFGPNWPNGRIDAEQVAHVHARSKIVLGVSTVGHSFRVRTPKLRDIEGLASGAVYLNLGDRFMPTGTVAGTHYLSYENTSECEHLIRSVLSGQIDGEAISNAALGFVEDEGSWTRQLGALRDFIISAAERQPHTDANDQK